MKTKVAIIIPAYNAVDSLEKSVRSVMRQTLENISIWIVDDGSIDGTGELADTLAKKDARITVIHQQNQGCYMARLSALKKINADYFGFVDADDEILPTMYSTMVAIAEQNNLSAIRCGIVDEMDENGIIKIFGNREEVEKKLIFPWLIKGSGSANVWNWLYKNSYDFNEFYEYRATMFEDLAFNIQFFKNIPRCAFLNKAFYKYNEVVGSAVHSFTNRHIHDFQEIIKFRNELITDKLCNASWTLKNLRGMIISAISADANFCSVTANMRKLLFLPEVLSSVAYAPKDKFYVFYRVALLLPSGLFVLAMKFALYLRKLWR